DIIAGFPTETDEMFENSLRLVDECDLTYLHIFPYSERKGTPAARMPQVEKSLRKERAARLRARGRERLDGFLDRRVGSMAHVLVERVDGNGMAEGHDEDFAPVRLAPDLAPGTLVRCRITGRGDDHLIGAIEELRG